MRDEQEQPKQQPRRVTQRLCISHWAIQVYADWIDSADIDLTKHIPLENYSQPIKTVRQVER